MNTPDAVAKASFLIIDTESVPDGKLLGLVKYPNEKLSPEEAILRAQAEAREKSRDGSDFLPVTFQVPIAVCVIRVGADFTLQKVTCLDAPQYRSRAIVEGFWAGLAYHDRATLVTFNGRGFDLPLLELAAFRFGCSHRDYFHAQSGQNYRHRFNVQQHFDILDWFNNHGACRHAGGLHLLSKLLGKPGKMTVSGDQVYGLFQQGKLQEINDYCMFDTLDTYFVFLRTRVLTGDLTLEKEQELVKQARGFLADKVPELPALTQYLDNWGEWSPWL